MSLYDKELFKNSLRTQGYTEYTDDQLDSMFTEMTSMYDALDRTLLPDATSPPSSSPTFGKKFGPSDIQYATLPDPNAGIAPISQFVGSLAYEFINTAFFGVPGVMDHEDYVENYMKYGDPTPTEEEGTLKQTWGATWGGGIGGLAGFAMPWGPWATGTRLIQGATKKLSKHSANTVVKNLTSKGSLLDTKLTELRPSLWGKKSLAKKQEFFEDVAKPVKNLDIWTGSGLKKADWGKSFNDNVKLIINDSLKGLRLTKGQVDEIADIIHKVVGTNKGGMLPVQKLQEAVARMVMGMGAKAGIQSNRFNKFAETIGHGFEEGAIFATVDSFLHSMLAIEGKTDMSEIPGVMGHAFLLGNALAGIRFLPGGKDQTNLKPAMAKINQWLKDKKTFAYDTSSRANRKSIGRMAIQFYRDAGADVFNKKMPAAFKNVLSSEKNIKDLVNGSYFDPVKKRLLSPEEGAEHLQKALNSFYDDWMHAGKDGWWRMWAGEFKDDMVDSSPRMLLGGLVNSVEVLFDENIPLNDKIFAFGVGAFITKRHREFTFRNEKTGKREVGLWSKGRSLTYSDRFGKVNKLLDFVGNKDVAANRMLWGLGNEEILNKHFVKAEETDDVVTLRKLMEPYVVAADKDIKEVKKPASAADHGIFSYLYELSPLFLKDGLRLKSIKELNVSDVKKLEKALAETKFNDVIGGKGVEFGSDIDDILIMSNKKAWDSVVHTYLNNVINMYNTVTGESKVYTKDQTHPVLLSRIAFKETALNNLKPDEYKAFVAYDNAIQILERIGLVKVSALENKKLLNLDVREGPTLLKLVDNASHELNKIYNKGEVPLDEARAPRFGDGTTASFLEGQGYFHGLNKIYNMLHDFENNKNLWRVDENRPGEHDGEKLLTFIKANFTDSKPGRGRGNGKMLLFDEIIVKGNKNQLGEIEPLQNMVNAFRLILKDHPAVRHPFIEGTAGKSEMSIKDAKILRKLLTDNGISGFNLKDVTDLTMFVRDLRRLTLDRRLKGGNKIVNGKPMPLLGRDRAVIGFLIESGFVKADGFELANIIGAVKNIASLPKVQNILGKMVQDGSKMMYTLNGAFRLDMITDSRLKDIVIQSAKNNGIAPESFVKDLLVTYKTMIEPFMQDGRGNGIFKLGAEVELDPGVLSRVVNQLKMIHSNDQLQTHNTLLETVERFKDNADYTSSQRNMLRVILKRFFGREGDSTSLLALLQKTALYNPSKGEFDFSEKDWSPKTVEQRIQEVMSGLNWIVPKGMTESLIRQRLSELKSYEGKSNETDVFDSITLDSFMKKYKIVDQWEYDPIYDSPFGIINDLVNKVNKDGKTWDQLEKSEKHVIIDEAIQVYKNATGRRSLSRLSGVHGAGIYMRDVYMANNSKFRLLDEILGESNFSIVDLNYQSGTGPINVFRDPKALKSLVQSLSDADKSINENLKFEDLAPGEKAIRAIGEQYFIHFGDMKWGIAIAKADVNKVVQRFKEWYDLKKNDASYSDESGKRILRDIKKILNEKVEEHKTQKYKDGEEVKGEFDYEYTFKPGTENISDGRVLTQMLNYMYMDSQLKGGAWTTHLKKTFAGKDPYEVAKLLRRVRLMMNVSGVEADKSLLRAVEDIYRKYDLDSDVANNLKEMRENDFKGLTVQDEKFTATFNTDGTLKDSGVFSLLGDALKQIESESTNKGVVFDKIEKNQNTGELEFNGSVDTSLYDSILIVRPGKYDAFNAAYGAGNIRGTGALKPIIAKLGVNPLLGKTAMVKHEYFQTFFEKNPDLDYLLVKSGAKVVGDKHKHYEDFTSFNDLLAKEGLGENTNGYQRLDPGDISFSMVKNSDKSASIPYQLTNWHGSKAEGKFYEWLLDEPLSNWDNKATTHYHSQDPHSAVAMARYLSKSPDNNGALKSYDYWIDNGGYVFTPLFNSIYKNQLRSKYLDDSVMSMKSEYGNQSPLVPDSPGSQRLRNTVFGYNRVGETEADRRVYTYGQMEASYVNRNKDVNLDNLTLIMHKKNDFDGLVKWSDILNDKGMKQLIRLYYKNQEKSQTKLGGGEGKATLLETFELVKFLSENIKKSGKYKDVDLEIAIAVHRPPSTRAGDIPVVGLKGILPEGVGNQARLNAWDMRMRIEGDFDIDTINYWWDTPYDVLKSWSDASGKVSNIVPDGESMKTSLRRGTNKALSWDNMESIAEYNANLAHAEYMRGVITKTQRVLQYLKHYRSSSDREGFSLTVPEKYRVITDVDNWDQISRTLAKDIQNIVDSSTGFNLERYSLDGTNWLKKFLFGDVDLGYDGVFKLQTWDGSKWIGGKNLVTSNISQEVIMSAISPYRTMLQLGTGVYSNGKRNSVKYENIISYMYGYNNKMKTLSNDTYWRLYKQYGKKSDEVKGLNEIFGVDPKGYQPLLNPFGDFTSNARPGDRGQNLNNLLPFERAMGTLAYKNRLMLDEPGKLFGDNLVHFQEAFDNYSRTNEAGEALKEVIKIAKSDSRALGFVNFLEWKQRNTNNQIWQAKKDGNQNLAKYLSEDLVKTNNLLREAEQSFVTDKEVTKLMIHSSAMSIRTEILDNLKTPYRVKDGEFKKFTSRAQAIKWVQKNYNELTRFARIRSKDGKLFKFVGVNTESHLHSLIWGNITGMMKDARLNLSEKDMINFERDVRDFKKKYRELYQELYSKTKISPHLSETNVANQAYELLLQYYNKWHQRGLESEHALQDGPAKLFLWKVMSPDVNPSEIAYFNGRLMPSYTKGSTGLIKLGLRFIAQSPEMRIPEMHKQQLFRYFAGNYNHYYNMFYGKKLSPDFAEVHTLQLLQDAHANHINASAPLIYGDLANSYKTPYGTTPESMTRFKSIQEEMNPQITRMFGFTDESLSSSYILNNMPVSPSSIGELFAHAERHLMPTGYVPNNYTGRHPKLNSWRAWRDAQAADIKVLLGDLTGGSLIYVDAPIVHRSPFLTSGTRRESIDEGFNSFKQKHKENGDINCFK